MPRVFKIGSYIMQTIELEAKMFLISGMQHFIRSATIANLHYLLEGVIPIELRTVTDCCRSGRVTC